MRSALTIARHAVLASLLAHFVHAVPFSTEWVPTIPGGSGVLYRGSAGVATTVVAFDFTCLGQEYVYSLFPVILTGHDTLVVAVYGAAGATGCLCFATAVEFQPQQHTGFIHSQNLLCLQVFTRPHLGTRGTGVAAVSHTAFCSPVRTDQLSNFHLRCQCINFRGISSWNGEQNEPFG